MGFLIHTFKFQLYVLSDITRYFCEVCKYAIIHKDYTGKRTTAEVSSGL